MIKRSIYKNIIKSLCDFPIVGLVGSRQAGKTTLAKKILNTHARKPIYLDLELPSDINKLQDAELFLKQFSDSLVIIDEIQKRPSIFPLLRALVDQNRIPGRFLILGSASPDLIKHASESLAGRIIYHELGPFSLNEVGHDSKNVNNLWIKGGYPESYLAKNNFMSCQWREAFIKTYLEKDIPQLGVRVPSLQLQKFWTMIAHSHGQLWNASQIANSLGVSAPTVKHYLDILTDTFIVRQLQPYYTNLKKRLIKSPKIYVRDTGLLHTLLKNNTLTDLQSHPMIGNSWEGFVIEQIINIIPDNCEYFFYRTNAGAEIDLVILKGKERLAVEIKYSLTPKVTKGFWISYKDLKCSKGFIVYPGNESYPVADNVVTLPVSKICDIVSNCKRTNS